MSGIQRFRVYVNSEVAKFHLDQLNSNILNIDQDVDQFINNTYTARIAAFHVPFPANTDWLEQLSCVYELCEHVFVFCSELHYHTVKQLISIDLLKISIFISGFVNHAFQHAKIYHWMDWFHTTSEFYIRTKPNFLDSRLLPYTVKPKHFDILLGNQRPHRDFVNNYVKENNLIDKVIMTYVYYPHKSIRDNPEFILENDNIEYHPDKEYTHSVNMVKYHGVGITLSQIIPLDIYNQTAYTLVAETNSDNNFSFYTEKIVKPILSRRLFVVISGKNYLKNLKSLGFKTFSNVIDESYDAVDDNVTRWSSAMDQVKWLSAQNQENILAEIKTVTEHNYQLVKEKNWYNEFTKELQLQFRQFV